MIKKIIKKMISVGLTAVVACSLMMGCGSSSSKSSDPAKLEAVSLKMYLLGDKPKDFDDVYGKVNERMKEKINATLDVTFIPWGDVNTKYQLLFQSGENFDLMFTATGWGFYSQVATKNGFLELTEDMLKKYSPITYENEPKEAWTQAKINGKIYMVPADNKEIAGDVYGVRGDLMKKYGIDKIESYADMEKYTDAAAKDESLKYVTANSGAQALGLDWGGEKLHLSPLKGTPTMSYSSQISFDTTDTSGKLVSVVDSPEYLSYLKKMKGFADKGYWPADAISSKDVKGEDFVAGNSALMIWNPLTVGLKAQKMNQAHPEWDVKVVDLTQGAKKILTPYVNAGMGINATSKNPERALMAIDLLRYDEEIHNLIFYGIEGTHYEKAGEGKIKTLAATGNFPVDNVCPWAFRVEKTKLIDVNQPAIVREITDKWDKNDVVQNPLSSFVFSDASVKNEISAVGNVFKEYGLPLELGMIPDVEVGLKQYREKLNEAGYNKVLEEAQKQASEHVKNYGK